MRLAASTRQDGVVTLSAPETNDVAAARVAVVDADRRIQQSLAEVLRVAGLQVVGTAGDVRSALELIESARPSVLLVDPRLPDVDAGAALLSSVALGWPSVRLVVMSWTEEPLPGLHAAHAFVSKTSQPEEFISAAIAACDC
jgi:DNA-binding NarL/FixJ family response regulator